MSIQSLKAKTQGLRHIIQPSRNSRAYSRYNKFRTGLKNTRNPAWLTLPNVTSSENKIVGLYAVWPYNTSGDSNYVALNMTVNSGTYTVNWGDTANGTVNYTSGTQADISYNWNDASLTGTDAPVTFSSDTVNRTSHGYINGQTVRFYNVVNGGTITEASEYFVVEASTNSFKIATTPSGSAVAFGGTGSASLLPYKIATITITPTTGGAYFTAVKFNLRNASAGSAAYSTGWLELAISCPSLTGMCPEISANIVNVYHSQLEFVRLVNLVGVTNMSYMFNNCYNLRRISVEYNTSNVLTLANIFTFCTALVEVPYMNTVNVTSAGSAFYNCSSLVVAPDWDLRSCTDYSIMFYSCNSLEYIPDYNFSACTSLFYFCYGCLSLKAAPKIIAPSVATLYGAFYGCYSLKYIPDITTGTALTNLSSAFQYCYSLQYGPVISNTTNVTNISNMYGNCKSLVYVPLMNTSNVTNADGVFQYCSSLTTVPKFNFSKANLMTNVFNGCTNLIEVPDLNTVLASNWGSTFQSCTNLKSISSNSQAGVSSSSSYSSMFNGCVSLEKMVMPLKYTFSIANCHMSAKALDDMYTALPTVTGQTVTVTGNYGTANDNPSIATAKGWTVTG